jgi:hypothetical protein
MEEHWQAGYEDTKVALGESAVLEPPLLRKQYAFSMCIAVG